MSNELQVNTYFDSSQDSPVIFSFSDGRFVVAWDSSERIVSGTEIYAQIHELNGDIFKSEFLVNTSTLYD